MKENLYAHVRRGAPRRRDWRLWAAVSLVLAVTLAVLIPLLWSVHYQLRFRHFVQGLSESTLAAYRAECLTAERDGELSPVSGGCGYQIYHLAAGLTPGRWGKPPEEPAPVVLDYGDGSTLSFWEVPLRNKASATGLFLWYTDPEGKSDGFSSALLHLDGIQRLLDQDAARAERKQEDGNG